jgi:hypothetical protein
MPKPLDHKVVWRPSGATGVVLLVHGLGADAADTWGPDLQGGGFLGRLLGSAPPYAVACVDYPARLGLPGPGALPPLSDLSAGLAATIRQSFLPAYDRLAVVAYCLGGLVAHFALADLLAAPDAPVARGRLMTVLLDSPVDWPDGPLDGSMAAVARMLRVDASTLRTSAAWWRDGSGPAARVAAHAVVSREACWVTPFKPGSTVPRDRVLRSRIAHLDLVRPPAVGDHDAYDHVAALVTEHLCATTESAKRGDEPVEVAYAR